MSQQDFSHSTSILNESQILPRSYSSSQSFQSSQEKPSIDAKSFISSHGSIENLHKVSKAEEQIIDNVVNNNEIHNDELHNENYKDNPDTSDQNQEFHPFPMWNQATDCNLMTYTTDSLEDIKDIYYLEEESNLRFDDIYEKLLTRGNKSSKGLEMLIKNSFLWRLFQSILNGLGNINYNFFARIHRERPAIYFGPIKLYLECVIAIIQIVISLLPFYMYFKLYKIWGGPNDYFSQYEDVNILYISCMIAVTPFSILYIASRIIACMFWKIEVYIDTTISLYYFTGSISFLLLCFSMWICRLALPSTADWRPSAQLIIIIGLFCLVISINTVLFQCLLAVNFKIRKLFWQRQLQYPSSKVRRRIIIESQYSLPWKMCVFFFPYWLLLAPILNHLYIPIKKISKKTLWYVRLRHLMYKSKVVEKRRLEAIEREILSKKMNNEEKEKQTALQKEFERQKEEYNSIQTHLQSNLKSNETSNQTNITDDPVMNEDFSLVVDDNQNDNIRENTSEKLTKSEISIYDTQSYLSSRSDTNIPIISRKRIFSQNLHFNLTALVPQKLNHNANAFHIEGSQKLQHDQRNFSEETHQNLSSDSSLHYVRNLSPIQSSKNESKEQQTMEIYEFTPSQKVLDELTEGQLFIPSHHSLSTNFPHSTITTKISSDSVSLQSSETIRSASNFLPNCTSKAIHVDIKDDDSESSILNSKRWDLEHSLMSTRSREASLPPEISLQNLISRHRSKTKSLHNFEHVASIISSKVSDNISNSINTSHTTSISTNSTNKGTEDDKSASSMLFESPNNHKIMHTGKNQVLNATNLHKSGQNTSSSLHPKHAPSRQNFSIISPQPESNIATLSCNNIGSNARIETIDITSPLSQNLNSIIFDPIEDFEGEEVEFNQDEAIEYFDGEEVEYITEV